MEFRKTDLDGLIEIFPDIFTDERGHFLETYQKELFKKNGIDEDFLQDNQSFSTKGVLRGLHLQISPNAQGKLVRVIVGKVLDIAVDLRPDSKTFGQYRKFILDANIGNMVYIPTGFAHGFVALEDTIFSYKCTNLYSKQAERGLIWNDPTINIDWEIEDPLISEKDLILPNLEQLKSEL
jgi:dTDP-4-dehydrorhamnose 3,5-epimerase